MWSITQENDPETATKLAKSFADEILAGRLEIDQAYPIIESYLTFSAERGEAKAMEALRHRLEYLKEQGSLLACEAASSHDVRDASSEAASSCMGDAEDLSGA